jgi:hypothetical protein
MSLPAEPGLAAGPFFFFVGELEALSGETGRLAPFSGAVKCVKWRRSAFRPSDELLFFLGGRPIGRLGGDTSFSEAPASEPTKGEAERPSEPSLQAGLSQVGIRERHVLTSLCPADPRGHCSRGADRPCIPYTH